MHINILVYGQRLDKNYRRSSKNNQGLFEKKQHNI